MNENTILCGNIRFCLLFSKIAFFLLWRKGIRFDSFLSEQILLCSTTYTSFHCLNMPRNIYDPYAVFQIHIVLLKVVHNVQLDPKKLFPCSLFAQKLCARTVMIRTLFSLYFQAFFFFRRFFLSFNSTFVSHGIRIRKHWK